jgi:glycosyltransferase involved in cell wall biosynthesis
MVSSQTVTAGVLNSVRADINRRDDPPHFVSVIVPVWNDTERLRFCLSALENQTYPSDLYEVIVVDNHAKESIAHVAAPYAHARVLHEEQPGSYAARNMGVRHARGEIIALTDADCIPAPDWLENGVSHLSRSNERLVVAGRIEIFPRLTKRTTPVEQYEMLVAFAQQEFVRKYRFGATANLFSFREVFARVGPFLTEVKSGGDMEWGRRVVDSGLRMEYAANVCVFHPARASLGELYQKIVRVTGGLHDLKSIKGRGYIEFDRRSLLLDWLPPLNAVARTMREPSLQKMRDRVRVCAVLFFVRYVQAFEKLRLSFPRLWNHHTTAR